MDIGNRDSEVIDKLLNCFGGVFLETLFWASFSADNHELPTA